MAEEGTKPNDDVTDDVTDDKDQKPTDDVTDDKDQKPVDKGDKPDDKGDTRDVLADADDDGDEGVPDQYTFEMPDDYKDLEIKDEVIDSFKAHAKELGLTQKQFDGLTAWELQRVQEQQQAGVDYWKDLVGGWQKAGREDPEFGGENYDANVAIAKTAIAQFGDKEFKSLLLSPSKDNPSGLAVGNNPHMLKFLHRVGKALADPDFVSDVRKGQKPANPEEVMYPSMKKD